MVTILRKFIEEYIDLIEEKDWRALYIHAYEEVPFQVGNLTTNLMHAGINPLDDLDVVLPGMFAEGFIDEVVLPVHISVIKRQAFMNCYMLKKINLPPALIRIDDEAFKGCYELRTITYEGTIKHLKMSFPDWEHFSKLFDDCPACFIHCIDGDVELL